MEEVFNLLIFLVVFGVVIFRAIKQASNKGPGTPNTSTLDDWSQWEEWKPQPTQPQSTQPHQETAAPAYTPLSDAFPTAPAAGPPPVPTARRAPASTPMQTKVTTVRASAQAGSRRAQRETETLAEAGRQAELAKAMSQTATIAEQSLAVAFPEANRQIRELQRDNRPPIVVHIRGNLKQAMLMREIISRPRSFDV